MERVQMTREGHKSLAEKIYDLKGRGRREVADELEIARAHGDLRENADYDAAKEKQGMLEAQIRHFEAILSRADIVDPQSASTDRVAFGLIVKAENLSTGRVFEYQIVSELESDLSKKRIAITAPLVRPLVGRRVGDCVEVEINGEHQELEVLEIRRP